LPLTQPGVVSVVTSLGWTSRRLEGTKWVEALLGSFGKWRHGGSRRRLGEHNCIQLSKWQKKQVNTVVLIKVKFEKLKNSAPEV